MDLTVSHRWEGNHVAVFSVVGEVDVYTYAMMRDYVLEIVRGETPNSVIIESSGIGYLDSTGVGVLVLFLKTVRRLGASWGGVSIVGADVRLSKIFRITGLTKVFPLHETVDGALEELAELEAASQGSARPADEAAEDAA
ncbi:STAS domain-containing protein [Streptomyces sp. NPDC048384]|uniref:STAS domain-containing protein n=1 Tax=Streptomyces sp. NPDC048384 TaxID=3155487 RepID=UPI0034384002